MATTHVGSIYWDASIKGIKQVQKQLKDLQTQIDALKPKREKEGLLAQIFGGAKGLFGVGNTLAQVSRFITRLGDKLVHFGQIASVFSYRLSLVVAGIGALAYKIGDVSADFSENLAFIGTQLDRGEVDIEEFTSTTREHIRNLSLWIPKPVNDIARAMYFLVSSLTIPPETARAMLEPIAMAATVGRSHAEATAKAGTVILNVYDHILESADGTVRLVREGTEGAVDITEASAEKVGRAVENMYNLMTLAVEKGTAEFSDFTSQLGDFALEAELAGVSLEELLAIYAAATRVTTPAMAATWVSNIFRRFTDPKFFEGLKSYGIQIKKFEEGTGRWVSVERTLTETQQDRIRSINISMEKQRNTLMRYVGTAESTWDTYMEGLKIFRETGFKRGGIDDLALNTYINFMENQRKLNEIIAEGTGTYREWRGELRPGVDMLVELAEAISNVEDEERQRQIVHDLFPSARAQRGFLAYLKGLKDINEWQEEWREDTNNLREDFEDVADTVNSRATLLWQKIQALGDIFYKTYEEDIKVFIGGLSEIADLFFKLDPRLAKQIALWGLLLLSLAPLSLIIGTMAIGIGTMVTAIGMLVSPGVVALAGGLFTIFGDKLKLAFDALKGYGISDMQDVVRFFMDLAVQLGIISESDAAGIMEAFGISLRPMGDPNVLKFIDAFKGMVDRIAVLKDDLVEWFDAFRLLLEDIANREGVIGTIVGYIERIAAAVLPFLGKEAAPIAGEVQKVLPGGETGPEGKKEILEFAGATYIGTKIVTAILAALGLGGAVPTVGVVAAIGAAVYTAMYPEEVKNFFTTILPEWWNREVWPLIDEYWNVRLPLEFEINVMAPARYFWETWLPTWWDNVAIPSWNNFWEEVFPAWWTTNVKDPIVNYFSEGGPFSAWWTANVKDPVTTFFTTGLSQWFTDNIKNPVVTFIESLPGRIDTLLTVTIPNKIGFWFGYIAGQALIAFMEWPSKIIAWISETGWPTLIEWIENTGWPALRKALTFSITGWLKGELLEKVEEGLFVDIVDGIVAVFNAGWNAFQRAWESFLEGAVEGFWTALFGPGGRPEEKEPPPTEPPPTEPSEFQLGGIIRRTGQVLAHAGEVVFNPRYPRQDLARVVNSAMARVGGGGELAPVTVNTNLSIGSFSGSQAEMTQLQNMLENMSFDMAMRVERKLAEARRVENRRRE